MDLWSSFVPGEEGLVVRPTIQETMTKAGFHARRNGETIAWIGSHEDWIVLIAAGDALDGEPDERIWHVSSQRAGGATLQVSRSLTLQEAIAQASTIPAPLRSGTVDETYESVSEARAVDGVVVTRSENRR